MCFHFFIVALTTYHNQSSLHKKEFIWANGFNVIRVHHGGEAWQWATGSGEWEVGSRQQL